MLEVVEITTDRHLGTYRSVWNSLLAEMPQSSFFQSIEWLEGFLEEYFLDAQLHSLVIKLGDQPIGLLPLVTRSLPTRLGSVEGLTYPTLPDGAFMGPVGRSVSATLMGAFQHLAKAPRRWDLIDLRGVDVAGADQGRTRHAFRLAHLSVTERPWSDGAVFDHTTLSSAQPLLNQRRRRDAERTLSQTGPWEHFAGVPENWQDFSRIQKRLQSFVPSDPSAASAVLPEWLAIAVPGRRLMIQTVVQRGQMVGWLASVAGNKRIDVVALHATNLAVQDILLGELLQGNLFDGPAQIVFGEQSSPLAGRWGAQLRTSWRYTYFSEYQARPQLLRLAGWLKRGARSQRVAS